VCFQHYEIVADVGNVVEVRHKGNVSKVLVMDERNFNNYSRGVSFSCLGGDFSRSPVSICLPSEGKWHVLVDLPENGTVETPLVKVI